MARCQPFHEGDGGSFASGGIERHLRDHLPIDAQVTEQLPQHRLQAGDWRAVLLESRLHLL